MVKHPSSSLPHGIDGLVVRFDPSPSPAGFSESPAKLRALRSGPEAAPAYKGIDTDFFGKPISGDRIAGPFADLLTTIGGRKIDPR